MDHRESHIGAATKTDGNDDLAARAWAVGKSELPLCCLMEAYPVVGDLAKRIALVLPEPSGPDDAGLSDWNRWLIRGWPGWRSLHAAADLCGMGRGWARPTVVFNKLISRPAFASAVSQKLMNKRRYSKATGVAERSLAPPHEATGRRTAVSFEALC